MLVFVQVGPRGSDGLGVSSRVILFQLRNRSDGSSRSEAGGDQLTRQSRTKATVKISSGRRTVCVAYETRKAMACWVQAERSEG